MKKFFLLATLFITVALQAQIEQDDTILYGNEWINYDQSYYRIEVDKDKIYRISYQELLNAGVFESNAALQGANFQLFYRGKEQAIYVSESATFQSGDYIEFFGQKNDGWLDQFLYETKEHQLNPTYSMYTDVSTYFLTWRSNTSNKRIENQENRLIDLPERTPYCWMESRLNYAERYQAGREYGSNSESIACAYDLGEGYAKATFEATQQFFLQTPHVFKAGPDAQVKARLYTKQGTHFYDWQLNEESFGQVTANGWSVNTSEATVNSNTLKVSNRLRIKGLSEATDRFHMVETSIRYPRTFDFSEQQQITFSLPATTEGHYLEIQNFGTTEASILYDLTNQKRLIPTEENGVLKVYLPPSETATELYLTSEAQIETSLNITARNFEQYDFENSTYDYILLSHSKLIDEENRYLQQYADYRASVAGGNFRPLIVDVTQLYDQFGYGVNRHEIGIKNFLQLAHQNWDSEYLFIVGKGIDRDKMRKRTFNENFDLVPSYGYPNADYLFTTFDDSSVPSMAVGRIAAYTPEHVRIYLKKIKEHDSVFSTAQQTLEDKEWTKRVLHFAGGDANIQAYIRNTLTNLKSKLDTSFYGSNAIVFAKGSSQVVSDAPEQVSNYINDGTAMLTFFGHSAPSTLDFNLGAAREYNNKGRYPFFYAIGCNTNRVFDVSSTLSEEWVLIEDKGAIGFFGSTWTTQLANLANYALVFYDNLGKDNYGERLGQVITATMADYGQNGNFSAEQTKQVLMLHGDPAIQLYSYDEADYLINKQESKVEPNILDLQQDSFQVNLTLHNIGKHIEDTLDVLVEHQLADGSWRTLTTLQMAAPDFKKELTINLAIGDKAAFATGRNQLRFTLDPDNQIVEGPTGAESNNQELLTFFVARSDVQPIFPENFSIVTTNDVNLQASTTDAFSNSATYFIEIDTTTHFDSPLKKTTSITQTGGVISWRPEMNWKNDRVYYWRIGLDNAVTETEEVNWRVRSFTYVEEGITEGWNQGHHFQFERNNYTSSSYLNEQLEFDELIKSMRIINTTSGSGQLADAVALFEDGFRTGVNNFPCGNGTYRNGRLNLVVFNETTLSRYGGLNPWVSCWGPGSWHMFDPNLQEDRGKLISVLENMQRGDYGIFYTTQMNPTRGYAADEWATDSLVFGKNIFQAFEERTDPQLLRQVAEQQNPYILIFQADNADFEIGEDLADNRNEVIEVESTFRGRQTEGSFYSVPIGPARNWQRLVWQTEAPELSDTAMVKIYGMASEISEPLLLDSTAVQSLDLSAIDAVEFPYLQLEYYAKDEANRTPVQLNYWRVGYESFTDIALAPNITFDWYADELQQGDTLQMQVELVNPTNFSTDSIEVRYTIIDAQNGQSTYQKQYPPLAAQSSQTIDWSLPTLTLSGTTQLLIEANPTPNFEENYFFNNTGIREFQVAVDRRNPLLDVMFDGARISNGDVVAAQPLIHVSLYDDNPYLILNDTNTLEIGILYPSGELKRFFYDETVLSFQKATKEDNQASAIFKPTFTENGIYQLQVFGRDRSNNLAGDYVYAVNFEVVLEEFISEFSVHPNPFSETTQFVFDWKGANIPGDIQIDIFSSTGQLVRTFESNDLGQIRIGKNRTTIDWNGNDALGQRLASGIYFYRVMAQTSNSGTKMVEISSGKMVKVD